MDYKDFVEKFFHAESERDWELYREFLHPEVEYIFFNGKERRILRGREAYIDHMKDFYEDNSRRLYIQSISETDDNTIITVLSDESGIICMDRFDFQDGLISRDTMFLGDTNRGFE